MILLFLFSPNFCIKAFYIYFDSRTQGLFSAQPKCKNNCAATPPSKFDVENEYHFLMCCKQYDQLRSVLFSKLSCPQFDQMNDQNKFCYMLTCPSVARLVGQFIVDAFDARPVP